MNIWLWVKGHVLQSIWKELQTLHQYDWWGLCTPINFILDIEIQKFKCLNDVSKGQRKCSTDFSFSVFKYLSIISILQYYRIFFWDKILLWMPRVVWNSSYYLSLLRVEITGMNPHAQATGHFWWVNFLY
jgi:hypothetical protein